jgi:two-component system, cell cycle response regulator DivK
MTTILIIEDNEKNLKLVRDLLQIKAYATLEAGSAEDGIAIAREHVPDLILMDIQLPGMNGIAAIKILRATPQTAHVPVIAVTASVMQGDLKRITEAGFDGYVPKPINVRNFLDTVREVLERRPK